MPRDYQQTHENLLQSAKKNFLKNGYERTNLRDICKDANVTNGAFYRHFNDKESLFNALVEPVIQTVSDMYSKSVETHFEIIKTDELKDLWKLSEETILKIIEYIYENFDTFKLLLMCSDGTKSVFFLDNVVRMEVKETLHLISELKSRHIHVNDLDENEWHMLVHAYYSSLFEIVAHNYSKKDAIKYAHTLAVFFSSGWQKVLGI